MQTSLYVFGGRINQQATNELWLFDTQTLCWMLLPSLGDSPFAVAGHTATLVNSKMIVLFGYGPLRGYTDKVQEYNLGKSILLLGSSRNFKKMEKKFQMAAIDLTKRYSHAGIGMGNCPASN